MRRSQDSQLEVNGTATQESPNRRYTNRSHDARRLARPDVCDLLMTGSPGKQWQLVSFRDQDSSKYSKCDYNPGACPSHHVFIPYASAAIPYSNITISRHVSTTTRAHFSLDFYLKNPKSHSATTSTPRSYHNPFQPLSKLGFPPRKPDTLYTILSRLSTYNNIALPNTYLMLRHIKYTV